MTVEDFDNLNLGDTIVSHNPIDGTRHLGTIKEILSHGPTGGPTRVDRVVIRWDDNAELIVWRDEVFTYPETYASFTVEKKV